MQSRLRRAIAAIVRCKLGPAAEEAAVRAAVRSALEGSGVHSCTIECAESCRCPSCSMENPIRTVTLMAMG